MGEKIKHTGEQTSAGCLTFFVAFCVSVGRSVNQRLATARNALRRKFRRDNKLHPLKPEELENETGTPDLVFKLQPVGPVKTEQLRVSSKPEIENASDKADKLVDDTVLKEQKKDGIPAETTLQEQVRIYIGGIIKNAVDRVKAEKDQKASESLTSSVVSAIAEESVSLSLAKLAILDSTQMDTRSVTHIGDNVVSEKSVTSIDSSEISQIAELAVSDSLSKISDSGNTNTSARRPRTVNEMLEYYGIPPAAISTDGMPPVDI